MSGREAPGQAPDQLMEEAAAWFARMRGPDAEASREAFEAWLRRGALHRSAYNRASEIFAMGKLLADDLPARSERRDRRLVLVVMAAILALAASAFLAARVMSRSGGPEARMAASGEDAAAFLRTLSSGPGETRGMDLPDGSRVILRPGTVVDVRLGTSERRLELVRGDARFQVFHERRPFVVHAGGARVTARGTVFDVSLAAGEAVTVRLVEGVVDVDLPARAAAGREPARRLRAGQTLSFPAAQAGSGRGRPPPPEPGPQTARDFAGVPVADLVAEASRSWSPRIRLADPAIGTYRVSGRFRIDDTRLLSERLALPFGLAVARDPDGTIVLRSR
jgi:transmembrane sensor